MTSNQLTMEEEAGRFVLVECLDMEPDHLQRLVEALMDTVASPYDHAFWNDPERIHEVGMVLARAAGLPCKPEHEQTHDMGRLVRCLAPISSNRFNEDDDERIVVNRLNYLLLACRFTEWFETLPFTAAMRKIKTSGSLYLKAFSPVEDLYWRCSCEAFVEKWEWFNDTAGLHDPETGNVDVETAALRKYIAIYGGKK